MLKSYFDCQNQVTEGDMQNNSEMINAAAREASLTQLQYT